MRIIAIVLALLMALPAMAQDARRAVLANAVDVVIRPAFVAFEASAVELDARMDALCATPSAETLEGAREGFRAQVLAWSRIEFWRMGPLGDENRADRIFFWPDRKGIALRQIQQILAEHDESATAEPTLRDKSVAVQGLGALEFVLFGTGADELTGKGGDFRCRYGHAIAQNLHQIAQELDAAWQAPDGIADHLANPTPDNDDFRTETEALEGIVGAMSHGIETVRDTRLQPFLGVDFGKPAPRSAPFWRSAMTVPAIAANFAGIAAMFDGTQIADALTPADDWIAKSVDFTFGNAAAGAAKVTAPVAEALEDEPQLDALKYLVIASQSLQKLIGENLAAALGLSVGFSALDGD